jgi:hypothetical protein
VGLSSNNSSDEVRGDQISKDEENGDKDGKDEEVP